MRWLMLVMLGLAQPAAAAEVPVLVYHDIVRGVAADPYAVTEAQFREQMAYLRNQGYRVISFGDYLAAARGEASLPDKPVMLTFDDGLTSFRDVALPVLERYRYPSVLAVTTGWLDSQDAPEAYRGRLLGPDALRAISRSPQVEILSHTDRLHQDINADPLGNPSPAAVARRYQAATGYESDTIYRERLRADLTRSAQRLTALTGKPPRGIVWPYGHYNAIGQEEATRLGMVAQLTLDERPADPRDFPHINRLLIYKVKSLADFEETLLYRRPRPPVRLLEVTLDDLSGRADVEAARWVRQLAGRARLLRANTVVVHPFSRDGRQAFFSNPTVPVASDRLHAVLRHLQSEAEINHLYLLLPASVNSRPAYQELARRHPYDGIVLSGEWSAGEADWLRESFEQYRPGMRCGTQGALRVAGCDDFRVRFVTAADGLARELQAQRPVPSEYVLVRFPGRPARQDVESVFRALRRAGVRHYGVSDRQELNEPSVLRQVAVELGRHVPPGHGD